MLHRIGKKIPEKMQNNYIFLHVCVFVRSVSKYLYLPHKYIQTCIQLHAILQYITSCSHYIGVSNCRTSSITVYLDCIFNYTNNLHIFQMSSWMLPKESTSISGTAVRTRLGSKRLPNQAHWKPLGQFRVLFPSTM